MESIGQKGESRSADFLKQKNYEIIARNWRNRGGEIDIIAIDKGENTLVFVEVKTLPNTEMDDLDIIINRKKQARISKTAKYFLKINRKYNEMCMRFDVIVVKSNPFLSEVLEIVHLKDAFGDCYD